MKKIFIFILFIIVFIPSKVYGLCESSHSCLLIDINSGREIYSKNKDEKKLIASTTKLMTFLVAYENGDLNKNIKVGNEILSMYGTSIYLSIDEEISLKDLLYGLILRSGNDASVVIANNIFNDYDLFIERMNKRAKELGMLNTIFSNPHGLDEDTKNYSTSSDMAKLIRHMYNIPFFREVSNTKHYVTKTNLKSYDWYNRNKIINMYKYYNSGKNGYTPSAGKTLVSTASKNNSDLICVSLDDYDVFNTCINLFEYGFNNYESIKVLDKKKFNYYDSNNKGYLYIKNDYYYLIDKDSKDLKIVINVLKNSDSNKVGSVDIYYKDSIIHKEELYIKYDKELSIFQKIYLHLKNILLKKIG